MYATEIYQLCYQALFLILFLSGPPIVISMIFGLTVAIFQAATQIQEQSLSFTVKLIAVVLTLMFMGRMLSFEIMSFAANILENFHRWNS